MKKDIYEVEENNDSENSDSEELIIGSIDTNEKENKWTESISIMDKEYQIKLDIGAKCNVLPLKIVKKRMQKFYLLKLND